MSARVVARGGAAVAASLLVIGAQASPSQATQADVTTEDRAWAPLFYDNFVTSDGSSPLLLYTGSTVEEECAEDFASATYLIRTEGDPPAAGSTQVELLVIVAPFYVYDGGGLDALQFGQEACKTLDAGGQAPTPIATGGGVVKQRINSTFHGDSAQPDVTDVNRAVGTVRTTEGERWKVRGKAELTMSPEFSVDHVSFTILERCEA